MTQEKKFSKTLPPHLCVNTSQNAIEYLDSIMQTDEYDSYTLNKFRETKMIRDYFVKTASIYEKAEPIVIKESKLLLADDVQKKDDIDQTEEIYFNDSDTLDCMILAKYVGIDGPEKLFASIRLKYGKWYIIKILYIEMPNFIFAKMFRH